MAKKRFLVIADSFIGMQLIRAEEKKIVEIETDPELGGMRPGSNLVEVDDKGNPLVVKAKAKRTAASHNDGTANVTGGGGDANKQGGNANDLA